MESREADPPREWECPSCRKRNPLFAVTCTECGERLTDGEADRQGLRGRETGLPDHVQREFAAAKADETERVRAHEEHLRNRLIRDMGYGAGIGFFSQFLIMILAGSIAFPLVYIPLGGLAGALLNRRGGGNFTGAWLFGGAFALGWILSVLCSGINPLHNVMFAPAFFIFSVCGMALTLVCGYLLGMTLSFERFEEGI
ncbi:MAG: hypothetical protein ACYTHN_24000 [Planctomycetota bacterium]